MIRIDIFCDCRNCVSVERMNYIARRSIIKKNIEARGWLDYGDTGQFCCPECREKFVEDKKFEILREEKENMKKELI